MSGDAHQFRPFRDISWPREKAEAAELIWSWRDQVIKLCLSDAPDIAALAEAVESGESPQLLDAVQLKNIRRVCVSHDLPLEWFTAPLRKIGDLRGDLRFEDANALKSFISSWVVPHASLVAKLAGVAHSWQIKQVTELSIAFFLTQKLVSIKEDLQRNHLFIPESDLEQAGVEIGRLNTGEIDAAVKKLLWKQVVRIRDAYAQGQPLVRDLERRYRRPFKHNWLTGLELINEIERRKYDVWTAPIELAGLQRTQVTVLSWIGKGASRARG